MDMFCAGFGVFMLFTVWNTKMELKGPLDALIKGMIHGIALFASIVLIMYGVVN